MRKVQATQAPLSSVDREFSRASDSASAANQHRPEEWGADADTHRSEDNTLMRCAAHLSHLLTKLGMSPDQADNIRFPCC